MKVLLSGLPVILYGPACGLLLNRPQTGIKPLVPHQFVVRALFFYPSVFQNDDPVRIHDRLKLVGDDDDGASLDIHDVSGL